MSRPSPAGRNGPWNFGARSSSRYILTNAADEPAGYLHLKDVVGHLGSARQGESAHLLRARLWPPTAAASRVGPGPALPFPAGRREPDEGMEVVLMTAVAARRERPAPITLTTLPGCIRLS